MRKANKWFLCEENQTLDLKTTHSVRRSLSFMLRSARLLCFVSVATISHERSEKVDFKVEPATWCQSPEEIPETFDFLKLSKRPFCFCFFLLKLSIFVPFCVNVANRIVRLDEKDLSIASLILPFRSVLLGRWSKLRVNDKLLCKSSYLTISKCHGGASVTNY